MSSSTHQIKVKANDQTAGAFASIQKRAQAAGINIRRMLGGAIAAASGYLGVKAFANGVDTLGRMSDVAMKASTSVDELTKASTALGILGIQGMGIDRIAQAFALMAKNTGRTGLSGFYETVGELGKISDISKRTEAAMKVFGKSGIEFMPLINAAKDGTDALQTLISAMPQVSQAAADAGDKLSDAKTIGTEGFKNLWLEAIGKISQAIDEQFKGGTREAALDGVAWLTYFAKTMYKRIQTVLEIIGIAAGAISADFKTVLDDFINYSKAATLTFSQKVYNATATLLNKIGIPQFISGGAPLSMITTPKYEQARDSAFEKLLKDLNVDMMSDSLKELEDYLRDQKKVLDSQLTLNEKAAEAYDNAAKSTGNRLAEDGGNVLGKGKNKIDNKLILGGSNEATKLALLGPQTQQELKKQTNILREIRDATRQTATNTDDIDSGIFDFTELN